MKPEQWQQIDELLDAALECLPEARAAFLATACAGDEELRREVESLLGAHERAGSFIEFPPAEAAAELLGEQRAAEMIGRRLGRYELLSLLGQGGMGEVYLAQDTRLRRKVALKLLPSQFTQDAARVRRFEQEAQAASALNHPNIITIYDLGRVGETYYIVSEFIEGQTLRQRMANEKLNLREVLDVAAQITSALAAAHTAGIVHRDIKPENVMVRPDGFIKVLDFGLAKLIEPPSPAFDTQTSIALGETTETGVVMGTPRYMSPEQARGLKVDARTDIFSLGAVLYEMSAGHVPFDGATTSDVIVSILEKEPVPLTHYRREIPTELDRIVKKALAKDREERYQLAKDLLIDLKNLRQEQELRTESDAAGPVNLKAAAPAANELQLSASMAERLTTRASEGTPAHTVLEVKGHKRSAILWTIAISVIVAVMAASFSMYNLIANQRSRSVAPFQTMKITRLINVGNGGAVISPDGKYIAYMIYGTATNGLWLKQTATESALRLLPDVASWGVDFTKDSNWVYCTVGGADHPAGALYKVPALGGSAKLVLEGITGGASLSRDGNRMAFKRNSKETGKPMLITANADGSDEHIILPGNLRYSIWAYDWSPDGKSIALSVRSDTAPSTSQVLVIPASGGEERPLLPPQREFITAINWVPDGSGLIMIAVDKTTALQQLWHLSYPSGRITRITNDSNWYTGISITSNGDTILATRNVTAEQNIWIGDAGDSNSLRKTTVQGEWVKWTPDGKVLYTENEDGKRDLWIMRADTTEQQRLTHDQSQDDWPVMSPDGRYIVFSSMRSGSLQLWRMDSDGRNLKQLTIGVNECFRPKITPDGQWVLYSTWIPPSGSSIKKIPVDGGEPVTLTDAPGDFVISPDGKMLAYQSFDEQKKRTIIVVKPIGGGEPVKILDFPDLLIFRIEQWTHEGLFYITSDSNRIILAPVDGHQPREYLKTNDRIFSFALSPDGRRIAVSRGVSAAETVMITDFKDRGQ